MKGYEEEEIISQGIIPGCTPDYVISQLTQQPLIVYHWKKNTDENQKALIDSLMRLPSKADCPGYIYGFREKKTYNSSDSSYMIKMGRTKRSVPQDRIFQWQKADQHEYNEIFTVRSQYNNKLELLIHLIFAYARKRIKINDKLRIEWFQFEEKVPTAAITNITNLLMEKIHEKYIDKLFTDDVKKFPAYDNILSILSQKEKIKKEDFSIVAFGLPKTGKTIFGNIVNGGEIVGEQTENGIKVELKPGKQKPIQFFEISDPNPFKSEEDALVEYFSFWQKLCSSKDILPILFVKQSDITSSKMIGLRQGFNLIQKYIKISDSILIVVTHTSKKFTQKKIKTQIENNKQFLTEKERKIFSNSQFIFINQFEGSGPLVSSTEKEVANKMISIWTQKSKKGNESSSLIEFKMDSKYLKICHQVIERSYQILQSFYSDEFSLRLSEYLQDSLQDNFVSELGLCISKMKTNESQLQSHQNLQKICQLLELKPLIQIQTFLYVFCEICTNKTLQQSQIMSQLRDKVNDKIIQVRDKEIALLIENLDNFRQVIALYGKKDSEIVSSLMKMIDETKLENMINILIKVIEGSKGKKIDGFSSFIKISEKMVQVLGEIDDKMKRGYRLDSVFGKVRQAIYYGLKGEVKQKEKQVESKEVEDSLSIGKDNLLSIGEEIQKQSFIQKQIEDIKSLNKDIENYAEGKTVINVSKVFSLTSPPATLSIKHNLIILAKQIKVYNNIKISFKTVTDDDQNKKELNLIFIAQSWTNINNLTIPPSSRNGKGLCLAVIDGQLINLKPETNSKLFEDKASMESLKKLYNSSFK